MGKNEIIEETVNAEVVKEEQTSVEKVIIKEVPVVEVREK